MWGLRSRALLVAASLAVVLGGASRAQAAPTAPRDRAPAPAPDPRPPLGEFAARAERLFAAILRDDPAHAREVFFPRDAFLQVKATPNPGRYYDRLYARFEQDVHTLHRQIAAGAQYERFELSQRGGYVRPGEEGNHLPYWAARHCFLHYREGGRAKKLEVRVLITWRERWYLIHLNEFH